MFFWEQKILFPETQYVGYNYELTTKTSDGIIPSIIYNVLTIFTTAGSKQSSKNSYN